MDAALKTDPARVAFSAEVTHKPGAVRLDKYPLLVYAPVEHGPGIRTEDNGTLVHDIAVASAVMTDLVQLATKFATTVEHIRQAIDYAVAAHTAAGVGAVAGAKA